jgi:RNA recognition motif-containing protein
MRKAGNVESANVIKDERGESKGCALVDYQHAKEADRAIRELHDSRLDGNRIVVRPAADQQQKTRSENDRCQVFVGNLPFETTWQQLKDHFRQVGPVEHAEVMETAGGRSKGWGLVRFSSRKDAASAIRRFHDADFQGRPLIVREDRRDDDGPVAVAAAAAASSGDNSQVFVKNLSYETTWKELKDHFRSAGSVDHAEVMETASGRSKGWGLVRFARPRDAAAAVEQLNGVELQGRALQVRIDRGKQHPEEMDTKPAALGRRRAAKPKKEHEEYDSQQAMDSALKHSR